MKNSDKRQIEALIERMRKSAQENSSGSVLKNTRLLVDSMADFATILTILSDSNQKSTNKVVWLTWALFALTLAMLIVQVLDAFSHPVN